MVARAILSNFFEKQLHSKLRTIPFGIATMSTFLEIAVCKPKLFL